MLTIEKEIKHNQYCIKDSLEAIERLKKQLSDTPKNKRGRKYLRDRIDCEKRMVIISFRYIFQAFRRLTVGGI